MKILMAVIAVLVSQNVYASEILFQMQNSTGLRNLRAECAVNGKKNSCERVYLVMVEQMESYRGNSYTPQTITKEIDLSKKLRKFIFEYQVKMNSLVENMREVAGTVKLHREVGDPILTEMWGGFTSDKIIVQMYLNQKEEVKSRRQGQIEKGEQLYQLNCANTQDQEQQAASAKALACENLQASLGFASHALPFLDENLNALAKEVGTTEDEAKSIFQNRPKFSF